MPSEPLPWDRKEAFFKDRKHERGSSSDVLGGSGGIGGSSCSTSRWRESYHGARDFPRSSPRRPFPGHYRHGGYHQIYPEESSVHGCTSSRSGDRSWLDTEICRPSSGRCASSGRSSSSGGRENRGSFRRSPYLDSRADCARHNPFPPVTAQRSVALPIAQISSSSSSLLPLKDHDKSSGGVIDGSETGQRCDRDLSLGSISWNLLKWSRPSSVPSSKTFRSNSDDACLETSVPQGKESPLGSPGASLPSDDGVLRKKPRLGWGQGLAKYEKQKVEGSVDCNGQNGLVVKDVVGGSSPKVMVFAGSMSPATPTSVTCSSSPGIEEKFTVKNLNLDIDRAKDPSQLRLNGSPGEFSIKVGQLDADSVCTLASALNDLMHSDDACSGDSSFTRFSTINKLMLLKNEISKELEKTEYEIDLFENELMSLTIDAQRSYREHPLKSKLSVGEPNAESFDKLETSCELPSSNNFVLTSSVFLEEEKVVQPVVFGECIAEATDMNHSLTEAFSSGVAQSSCLERQNHNSNVLFDLSAAGNGKCVESQSVDAEPSALIAAVIPAVDFTSEPVYSSAAGKENDDFLASIMGSNENARRRASEEFEQVMPSVSALVDIWESDKLVECRKNYMLVRDKLAVHKRLSKFKEHVLAHKFRVLHHLWREDVRLLAVLKHRPKSSKRLDVNNRSFQTLFQKHRSSTRSRFPLPGNPSLVPTTEILNFTSKILSGSQIRRYRNQLKMPAQIIDEKEKMRLRFNTKNGLIDDAPSIEKERLATNPWTVEEEDVFLEMLATFGKDFGKISSFITHKTIADCIEFYYKNHRSEKFKQVMEQLKHRNQCQRLPNNKYLITSGAKWKHDFLGATTTIDSQANNNPTTIPNSVEISGTDREAVAADVLIGICGSSEAMSSCATSFVDPRENAPTPEATHAIEEEDACSDGFSVELGSADWTDSEKSLFVRAFNMYGKDFVKISEFVRSRSREHCKIFFSKARKCLGLEVIQFGSVNGATPPRDANGGRSDTDDAFAAEIDSTICSTQSCSKMDVESMSKSCDDYLELVKSVPEEVDGNFEKRVLVNGEPGKDQGKITPLSKAGAEDLNKSGDESSASVELKVKDSKQLVDKGMQVKLEDVANIDDSFCLANKLNVSLELPQWEPKESRNKTVKPAVSSEVAVETPTKSILDLPEHVELCRHLALRNISLNQGYPLQSDCFLSAEQNHGFSVPRPQVELPFKSEDRFKRMGDVKLFGQILSHPSSTQMLASPGQNCSAKSSSSPGDWKDASVLVPRPGSNGFSQQQGESAKNGYGFWDGNRIRLGFSTLPEPAIILAKYQGTLPGIADYKQQVYMESLSANKKLLEGFEVISGRQQQGRVLPMGRSMVGGTGVSDPVAASLQVHYSGGRAKLLGGGEVEQWVGDGGGR